MPLIALIFYNIFFPIFFIFYLPVFITKLVKRGGFKEYFWERFGFFSASKKKRLKSLQNPIWIHAVSVGETIAALSFLREWSRQEPDLKFVLSTTTSTGQKIAREQSPKNVISIYCPIDFFIYVWSTLNAIKPQMLIIFEVEVWPNLIALTAWREIKLALVNCRMSDKSAQGYARHRWFFNYIFSRFSLICTQTTEDACKIKSIIGDQPYINVCNTMKFDQLMDSQSNNIRVPIDIVFPDKNRLIFVAASTHPGEEAIMVKAFKSLIVDFPYLNFILAPRHTERTYEVEKILKKEDMDYVLLTELKESLKNGSSTMYKETINKGRAKKRVLLVNTTGDLMGLFAVSDIVFMGKSLCGVKGGHNIIEPAIFGKPVIFGSNMDNFRQVAKIFRDNKAAVEVENEQEFCRNLRRLLGDPAERERLGKISREVVEKNRGAINKTIELLRESESPRASARGIFTPGK